MKLETGKLDSELLKKIVFGKITYRSEDVSVRPGMGKIVQSWILEITTVSCRRTQFHRR